MLTMKILKDGVEIIRVVDCFDERLGRYIPLINLATEKLIHYIDRSEIITIGEQH